LCSTKDYEIWYQGILGEKKVLYIHGFVDADWIVDIDHRISTCGYLFNLFVGEINWLSKRQSIVVLSTTKFEYMVYVHASKEVVWLHTLSSSIGFVFTSCKVVLWQ